LRAVKLFDTHFHLTDDDDACELIARAEAAGVGWLTLAGAPAGRMEELLERIRPFPNVYAAVGVHPHDAEKFDDNIALYRQLSDDAQAVAIGEVGLDYFYDTAPKVRQKAVFGAFLDLAAETGQPVVIHCRDAFDDCYELLTSHLPDQHPFVIHCYTGPVEWVERMLAIGGFISFTGIMTFKKAEDVRAAMREVPLDRLMFETDSPYLAPIPFRGKRNEPAYVRHVVEFAAEHLGVAYDELVEKTTQNAFRFYGISPERA
jgi:TatD DNase family protein